jgi:phosphoglycolate phosphatase
VAKETEAEGSPAMIRLCIFDCDGTLVDGQWSIVTAMAEAFSSHGHPPPAAEAVRRVIGLSLRRAIAVLLPEGDEAAWERLAGSYGEAFAACRRENRNDPLYPGAAESLAALTAAGWSLGMATGKSRRGALATLACHGLDRHFASVQAADVAAGKPDPQMILQAMAETGAVAASTVMVGDTTFDMRMAANASVAAIGVTWGYHAAEELVDAGAQVLVERFADLLPAADRLVDGAGRRPPPRG